MPIDKEKKRVLIDLQKGINKKYAEITRINANKAIMLKSIMDDSEITYGEFREFYAELKLIRDIG